MAESEKSMLPGRAPTDVAAEVAAEAAAKEKGKADDNEKSKPAAKS